jgi:hypothetical protein
MERKGDFSRLIGTAPMLLDKGTFDLGARQWTTTQSNFIADQPTRVHSILHAIQEDFAHPVLR